jgi:hypothetical protein
MKDVNSRFLNLTLQVRLAIHYNPLLIHACISIIIVLHIYVMSL